MTRQGDQSNVSSRRLAVAATVVAGLVTFAVAEFLVRNFLPYNTPDTVRQYSLEYEPAVYSRTLLKPVDRVVEVDSKKAWGGRGKDEPSEVAVFISPNGYRGPAFDVRKPPGTTRIIVLGGSSVFDQGVPDRDDKAGSWPHLLERQLVSKGLSDLEVINAGIPGHATGDSLGRLFSQLWMYEPDYVLVYHGWNDMKFWKSQEVTPERPLIQLVPPYDENSNPFISYRGFWDRLLSNSQIYVKIRNRYYMSKLDVGTEGVIESRGSRETEYGRFGPDQFRLNLELIVSACNLIDAVPVLVTQATLVAPDLSEADRKRINYDYQGLAHDTLVAAYEESYRIIREVSARNNTAFIDAAVKLNGSGEHFADHVHLSPPGSMALAEIIAEELAPLLMADEANGE